MILSLLKYFPVDGLVIERNQTIYSSSLSAQMK